MKITVTADDINNGLREDGARCPIALAIKRIAKAEKVEVGTDCDDSVWIDKGRYSLPDEALNFYRAFDSGEQVAPFEFELDDDPENDPEAPAYEPEGD